VKYIKREKDIKRKNEVEAYGHNHYQTLIHSGKSSIMDALSYSLKLPMLHFPHLEKKVKKVLAFFFGYKRNKINLTNKISFFIK
jgi:hypothetical protein